MTQCEARNATARCECACSTRRVINERRSSWQKAIESRRSRKKRKPRSSRQHQAKRAPRHGNQTPVRAKRSRELVVIVVSTAKSSGAKSYQLSCRSCFRWEGLHLERLDFGSCFERCDRNIPAKPDRANWLRTCRAAIENRSRARKIRKQLASVVNERMLAKPVINLEATSVEPTLQANG